MNFFKGLFGKKAAPQESALHGISAAQTQEQQDATRERMESEMAGQKAERDEAAEARRSEESTPDEESTPKQE